MLQSLLGVAVLTALAWVLSEDRKRPGWRIVAAGLGLQFAVALILLKLSGARACFLGLNALVQALDAATTAGTSFVFGYLGGGPLPFAEPFPGASFILAFKALPLVLVVSALSSLLFYWRVIPVVVRGISWGLQKALGIGGAVAVAVAANVFVGMVEAPLLVRPYLARMGRGELFMVMTSGMATIAGTMMALYATVLSPVIPDAVGHILTASLISAPAAVMVAALLVPAEGEPTGGGLAPESSASSAMDAVTRGALDGLTLLLNIVALLIVLVALVALANMGLALLPDAGDAPLTLQRMLGWLMAPVCWLMGVPWSEAAIAGGLMGEKTILNEFIAYLDLARLPAGALSERSRLIMTYAMCGFANLGSLGIMLGGLCAMAPQRRPEIVGLGLKSILSGTLATCLTGAVAGVLL
ncbi:MAG: nucleoside transporter C-terminal domain-containing protein [Thermodesulfobacteriota bacterium]